MIIFDKNRDKAKWVYDTISKVEELNREIALGESDLDFLSNVIIVIGGDGFFLHTIHENGFDKVYFPLNTGTLGYLLNNFLPVSDGSAPKNLIDLMMGPKVAYSFNVLKASIHFRDGSVITDLAVNDVYVERASGQTARLTIDLDNSADTSQSARMVDTLSADGIICSTALGSTAYNYSAGGPIVHPLSNTICLTPIAPHRPKIHPMVLSEDYWVKIAGQDLDKRPLRAVVDGRDYTNVESVMVRKANEELKILYFEGHNFLKNVVQFFK